MSTGMNAGDQLGKVEGFCNVIIATQIERLNLMVFITFAVRKITGTLMLF